MFQLFLLQQQFIIILLNFGIFSLALASKFGCRLRFCHWWWLNWNQTLFYGLLLASFSIWTRWKLLNFKIWIEIWRFHKHLLLMIKIIIIVMEQIYFYIWFQFKLQKKNKIHLESWCFYKLFYSLWNWVCFYDSLIVFWFSI